MRAFIFDVDGVLCDLEQKKVVVTALFPQLTKILNNGDILAFNTGRSLYFVKKEIIEPLKKVSSPNKLENVIIVAEKGSSWLYYKNLREEEGLNEGLKLPSDFVKEVKDLTRRSFSEIVFIDETKKAIITLELRPGKTIKDLDIRRGEIRQELESLISSRNLKDKLEIEDSSIGFDIEVNKEGKALGIDVIERILAQKKIKPTQYLAFGDSEFDFEMGQELLEKRKNFTFVFVGEDASEDLNFPIERTKAKYEKGTLEYLQSH